MLSAALTGDSLGNLGMELYFFSLHQSFGAESHMLQSHISDVNFKRAIK